MKLFLMIFPRISLHCTLVPVQNREYENGLLYSNLSHFIWSRSPCCCFTRKMPCSTGIPVYNTHVVSARFRFPLPRLRALTFTLSPFPSPFEKIRGLGPVPTWLFYFPIARMTGLCADLSKILFCLKHRK